MLLAENTKAVERREQEIMQIVRSLHELNEIFRDVAQLVVDQVNFKNMLFLTPNLHESSRMFSVLEK